MLTASPIAVDADTAAEMLGRIGRSTFLERVSREELPKARKLGAKLVWLVEELQCALREEPKPRRMADAATALYRHFGVEGELLYVGISLSPVARLAGHRSTSNWTTLIRQISIEWFPDRDTALAAELEAIRGEAPIHNRAGVVR